VCPRGQVLSKHGEQLIVRLMIFEFIDNGGVYCGELDPNNAINGVFKAAAMCISPESFVTTHLAPEIMCMASFKLVLLVRSVVEYLLYLSMALPISVSLLFPSMTG